jgi:hypothetical protein
MSSQHDNDTIDSINNSSHQNKHRQYLKKISETNSIDKNKNDLALIDKEM